jgi:trk system potassium uptake protein TrkH
MRVPRLAPAQALSVGIAGLVLLGTLLLALPVSSAGQPISLLDAFFTATSAVCVTGLIVLDTPHALSLPGQLIVLLLIQAGGLGYMVIRTIVGVALGKRLGLQERLTLPGRTSGGEITTVAPPAEGLIRADDILALVGSNDPGPARSTAEEPVRRDDRC